MRDLQLPGRSPVICRRGAVATSHPLSTEEGIRILRRGGSAVDAAIAAVAVQGVVEPYSTSIGGDCFALVRKPAGGIIALNGSGALPQAFDAERVRSEEPRGIGERSPHAVTVPGAIAAWERLNADHGKLPFGDLLESAIGYARDGYAVTPRVAHDWLNCREMLADEPEAARVYLRSGEAPAAGDVHRQPDLAASLERIAQEGASGFYSGPLAEAMVAELARRGGFHTVADFEAQGADYVEPISATYRGHKIWECPPNGQGIIALVMLKLLERFDIGALSASPVARVHLLAEATRQGYGLRAARLGDPSQCAELAEEALSERFIDEVAARIDPERASGEPAAFPAVEHKDTVYVCAADESGTLVSLINSVFHHFAGAIVPPGTGILLHNRGSSFSLEGGHPNFAQPGRRPMHTIIPGMSEDPDGNPMAFGVMGGHYQAAGHAQFMAGIADFGLDPQEALDRPRSFLQDGVLDVERPLAAHVPALSLMGHDARISPKPIGGGQAVRMLRSGGEDPVLVAGSDCRKDGMAAGY